MKNKKHLKADIKSGKQRRDSSRQGADQPFLSKNGNQGARQYVEKKIK